MFLDINDEKLLASEEWGMEIESCVDPEHLNG